jgi:hypothetical protein
LAALAAVGVALVMIVCIVAAFTRFSVVGLCLLWLGPQVPTLLLTDPLQGRYTYLPALVTFLFVASGGMVLFEWLAARRTSATLLRAMTAIVLVAVLAISIRGTTQASTTLRATEVESRAFSAAVVKDHPSLQPHTTIFLIGSPLDGGSARWVFADPRLRPQIHDNVPLAVERAASLEAVAQLRQAPPILIYEREPTGTYVERFLSNP